MFICYIYAIYYYDINTKHFNITYSLSLDGIYFLRNLFFH